ncbi:Uncharacterised protein [Mycobacteroides abscessus]|nr:Uncharacterised protein [Mycobacteroides abscessus]
MPTSTGSALVLVSPPALPPLASVGAQAASARLAAASAATASADRWDFFVRMTSPFVGWS